MSIEYIHVNLNDTVKVRLNKSGIDELKRQHDELASLCGKSSGYFKVKIDNEGFSKFQLHDLMSSLGHLCNVGCEPPFDTNIVFLKINTASQIEESK